MSVQKFLLVGAAILLVASRPVLAEMQCSRPPASQRTFDLSIDLGGLKDLLKVVHLPELTAKIQFARKALYQQNLGTPADQLNAALLYSICTSLQSDASATDAQKREVLLSAGRQLSSGQTTPAAVTDYVMTLTPNAGVAFKQGGTLLPIRPGRAGELVVRMQRAPFQLLLERPVLAHIGNLGPALQVTVSSDPSLLNVLEREVGNPRSPFFQPGTGMADSENGSGRLVAVENLRDRLYPHNYIVGGRFNQDDGPTRGAFIGAIEPPAAPNINLIASAPAVYLVLRQDIRAGGGEGNIDFVQIAFSNVNGGSIPGQRGGVKAGR